MTRKPDYIRGPEFSEDEFECNLLNELRVDYSPISGPQPYFKPSRNLEGFIGYDIAVMTTFFEGINFNNYLTSERIDYDELVDILNRGIFVDESRRADKKSATIDPRKIMERQRRWRLKLPTRFASAFLQCKVSEYVYRDPRRPHTLDQKRWDRWNSTRVASNSFYQFSIDHEQNWLLMQTDTALKGKAIVAYAAPCFHTFSIADIHLRRRQTAENTHFQFPGPLGSHSIYTYKSPDEAGIGFSDPEQIDSFNFTREIQRLLFSNEADMELTGHLKNLERGIVKVLGLNGEDSLLSEDDFSNAQTFIDSIEMGQFEEKRDLIRTVALVYAIRRFSKEQLNSDWILYTSYSTDTLYIGLRED